MPQTTCTAYSAALVDATLVTVIYSHAMSVESSPLLRPAALCFRQGRLVPGSASDNAAVARVLSNRPGGPRAANRRHVLVGATLRPRHLAAALGSGLLDPPERYVVSAEDDAVEATGGGGGGGGGEGGGGGGGGTPFGGGGGGGGAGGGDTSGSAARRFGGAGAGGGSVLVTDTDVFAPLTAGSGLQETALGGGAAAAGGASLATAPRGTATADTAAGADDGFAGECAPLPGGLRHVVCGTAGWRWRGDLVALLRADLDAWERAAAAQGQAAVAAEQAAAATAVTGAAASEQVAALELPAEGTAEHAEHAKQARSRRGAPAASLSSSPSSPALPSSSLSSPSSSSSSPPSPSLVRPRAVVFVPDDVSARRAASTIAHALWGRHKVHALLPEQVKECGARSTHPMQHGVLVWLLYWLDLLLLGVGRGQDKPWWSWWEHDRVRSWLSPSV